MDIEVILKALGDPTRFRIFQNLLKRKHCVRSLSKAMNITESAVSQHMKVLREADLVYGEKFGYHTHYLPKQETLDFLSQTIITMAEQSERLDRTGGICNCEFREIEAAR
ncbi:MAG: ArsR family transcriptional regulator [Bacillota bacterium]|nr:MAG: ArsR family transcriptional regulator [Bacillota bacterium]